MANSFKKITSFVFAAVLATMPFAFSASAAWQNPLGGTVPPDNNADAPINVGGTTQTKSGGLNISGNVGIGTDSPAGRLHVSTGASGDLAGYNIIQTSGSVGYRGGLLLSNSLNSSSNSFKITSSYNGNSSSAARFGFISNTATENFLNGGPALDFRYNGNVLLVQGSGNVGISSTTPNFLLSLDGSSGVNRIGIGNARIVGLSLVPINDNEAASKYYVENYVDSFVSSAWTVNGTNIYNSNSGNVGIGITNPSNKLHVYYASNGFAKIDTGAGQVSGVLLAEAGSNKWAIANRSGDSNNLYFSASPSGTIGGNIASAAKMTITQSGNVGIGTTNPTAKLEVNGAIKQDRGQRLNLNGRNRTWQIASYPKDATNSGNSEALIVNLYDSSTYTALSYNTVIVGRTGEISLGFSGGSPHSSYPVSIRTYDDGTNINVYVVSSNYCDYYTVDVVYNRLNNILTQSHVGDNTYTPAGSLVADSTTAPCYMSAGGQVRSTLLANGNFGIGTSNPAEKLDVVGNGVFSGDLSVGGQINLGGADAAEEFIPDKDYSEGTVLVMAEGGFKNVTACSEEYDSGVVGVVSGQASIIMGKVSGEKKTVVAMVGVVPVKVNDSSGLIKKGDLLTTSSVKGEAMLAVDPKIGTVIGKALEDAIPGHCEIQTLINLQ